MRILRPVKPLRGKIMSQTYLWWVQITLRMLARRSPSKKAPRSRLRQIQRDSKIYSPKTQKRRNL